MKKYDLIDTISKGSNARREVHPSLLVTEQGSHKPGEILDANTIMNIITDVETDDFSGDYESLTNKPDLSLYATIEYVTQNATAAIMAPVNANDASSPITALNCELSKYYRIDVPVDTLAITLPAITDLTTVRTVVIYLTAGTTPAVTISSTAVSGGTAPDVVYQDGFEIETGGTYEINALFNGAAWIVAAVKINVE